MAMTVHEITPVSARVEGLDVKQPLTRDEVDAIEATIAKYPVLVFPNQSPSDEQQMAFTANFGALQRVGYTPDWKGERLHDYMTDVSNLHKDNSTHQAGDRSRMNHLGSRRFHTDGSWKRVSAKYSLLSAHVLPPVGGETQFADMRAAYDALPPEMKALVEDLVVQHWLIHSRRVSGFEPTEEELKILPPVQKRLVRTHPISGRKSLYIGSHAHHIVGWPLPEGLDLLYELNDFATRSQFVYTHKWQVGELVMWDNRSILHRARRHFPENAPRDLRRTSVDDDVAWTVEQAA